MGKTAAAVARPEIIPVLDSTDPPLHWYGLAGHEGGQWTSDRALATTITELTVHWSEENTPPGLTAAQYLAILGNEARYHAFDRNWGTDADPIYGDGLMYHYAISPAGHLFQTTAETKRTWNSYQDNACNLAVVMMAGHADGVTPAAQATLVAFLNWMCYGRADLPGVTAKAQAVTALSAGGPTVTLHTRGVLTHDESLEAQGRPPKGCCGVYAPVVQAWRAKQGLI